MAKCRSRFRNTLSLDSRLRIEADRLRTLATQRVDGDEKIALLDKAEQHEAAIRINAG